MSKLFKDFILGVRTSFSGLTFVFENRMGHFFVYPLVVTLALAWAGMTAIETAVTWIKETLREWMGWEDFVAEGDSWWDTITSFFTDAADLLLSFALWLVFYFVLHKVIKYFVLILMSPVMALISEKTEEKLTGNTYSFNLSRFAKDVWRGMLIAGRNFFVETGCVLLLWLVELVILSFLPFLGIILTPITFILSVAISSYFWGFSTMDYNNERRKLNLRESVRFIRKYGGVAIGNGLVFTALIGIPVIGTYLGPVLATVMCTVGATLAIHEKVNLKKGDYFLDGLKDEASVE